MLEHLNDILENTQITASTAAVRLAISFVLGAIIGVERQFRRRDAGMRTLSPPKSLQVLVSWEQELLFKVMEACMDSLRRLVFG